MIRVANVLTEGRFGGPHQRIMSVAPGLRALGIETVLVIPARDSSDLQARLAANRIPFVIVRMSRLSRSPRDFLRWLLLFVPELLRLSRTLRMINPDIVHCNGVWQIKPVLAARATKAKVVLHLNDTRTGLSARLLFHVLAPLCHVFILAGHRVGTIYLSNDRLRAVPHWIVPAPVDTSAFDPARVEPASLLAGTSRITVVSVGNINPDKGFEYLIEAAHIVCEPRRDISFHVFGNLFRSQAAYIRRLTVLGGALMDKQLTLHGPVDDVAAILKAADIYVCSSVAEASPVGVWEALSMGLPVVSTDVGDVSLILENGRSGFVVPTRDAKSLALAIQLLAEDPALRARLGEKARQVAIAYLDVPRCVALHAQVYRSALDVTD